MKKRENLTEHDDDHPKKRQKSKAGGREYRSRAAPEAAYLEEFMSKSDSDMDDSNDDYEDSPSSEEDTTEGEESEEDSDGTTLGDREGDTNLRCALDEK